MKTATDEISTVHRVNKDGGSYAVKCPHCGSIIGVEGEDLRDVRGQQYIHFRCGGWMQVDYEARFVHEL